MLILRQDNLPDLGPVVVQKISNREKAVMDWVGGQFAYLFTKLGKCEPTSVACCLRYSQSAPIDLYLLLLCCR